MLSLPAPRVTGVFQPKQVGWLQLSGAGQGQARPTSSHLRPADLSTFPGPEHPARSTSQYLPVQPGSSQIERRGEERLLSPQY